MFCGDGDFRANLVADPEVASRLSSDAITACFDLDHALAHVPAIVARALGETGAAS